MQRVRDSGAVWLGGLAIGVSALRREPALGLKRLVLPTSYWRTAEFAYVYRQLRLARAARVLDLGSPKDLASILARRRGYHVTATDIQANAVELCARFAAAQGIVGHDAGEICPEVQDGRHLSYPDNHFDGAFCVSVLEHIPDGGDGEAIAELVRVVKPGGLIVVTTPYDRVYRETFVRRRVYERDARPGEEVFWERHYDAPALASRLLSVAGARCIDREVWGEARVRGEALLRGAGRLRAILSPLEPLLATVALRPVNEAGTAHPMAVFFTLEKLER